MKYTLLIAALFVFNVNADECVMVDTNGNTYVSNEWTITQQTVVKGLKDFKEAFGTDNEEFDYNENGIVDFSDLTVFKQNAKTRVETTIHCTRGNQQ